MQSERKLCYTLLIMWFFSRKICPHRQVFPPAPGFYLHLCIKPSTWAWIKPWLAHSIKLNLIFSLPFQDSKSGRTALHHAVEAGNLGMTGYLIFKCKAEVDAMNFDECTPLHTAAGRGMESMVAMLLAAGADPKVTNFEGESPRDHAHSEVGTVYFNFWKLIIYNFL